MASSTSPNRHANVGAHPGEIGDARSRTTRPWRCSGCDAVGKALEGAEAGAEGNVGKLLGSEHDKRVTDLAMRIAGADAVFDDGDMAVWANSYLFSPARCRSPAAPRRCCAT